MPKYFPFNLVVYLIALQLPHKFTQFHRIPFVVRIKRHFVVCVSCFKRVFCQSDICLRRFVKGFANGCNCGLIDN